MAAPSTSPMATGGEIAAWTQQDLAAFVAEELDRSSHAVRVRQLQGGGRASGQATMPFAGTAGPVTVTVAHGMRTAPVNVVGTYRYGGAVGLFLTVSSIDATNIVFSGVATGVVASQAFDWVALG